MGAVWKAVAVLRLTWALLVIKVLFTARRMGRLRLAPKRLAYEEMYKSSPCILDGPYYILATVYSNSLTTSYL